MSTEVILSIITAFLTIVSGVGAWFGNLLRQRINDLQAEVAGLRTANDTLRSAKENEALERVKAEMRAENANAMKEDLRQRLIVVTMERDEFYRKVKEYEEKFERIEKDHDEKFRKMQEEIRKLERKLEKYEGDQ